jgi:uncharacterized membrane protein
MKIGALVVAIVGAVVLFLKEALGDGGIEQWEWVHIVAIALAAFGVWLQPNTTVLKTAKTWVMGIAAGLVALESLITNGITPAEWLDVIIVVLTAAGVLAASVPRLTPLHSVASITPGEAERRRVA